MNPAKYVEQKGNVQLMFFISLVSEMETQTTLSNIDIFFDDFV